MDYSRDFYTMPPAELIRDLTGDFIVIARLIEDAPSDIYRADLAAIGGQLAVFMAMSLASLGQYRTARRWWHTAKDLADQSGDTTACVWVRDWEVVNGTYEGRPAHELLELADATLALGGELISSGVTGILSGRSQILAMQGRVDEAMATLRDLEEMTALLPSPVQEDELSMHGWPEFRLRYTESWVYTLSEMRSSAVSAQDRALSLYPRSLAKERAQMEMHRAGCLVALESIDEGIQYAQQSLDALPAPFHNELLYTTARQFVVSSVPERERHRPDVRDFLSRLNIDKAVPEIGA